MTDPFHTTLSLLEHTRNQAAVPVLVAALDSQHEYVRTAAISALTKRRSSIGHNAILHRFPKFNEREQAAVAESLPNSTDPMKQALHEAVLSDQTDLCESACRVMLLRLAYEHLPTLVDIAENRPLRHSDQAAATLIQLTRRLHDELAGQRRHRGRDPFFVRRQVLPSVERSVMRFGEHQRLEIVDAYLLLVPSTDPTLGKILSDSSQTCHEPVIASLRSSAVTAILELLAQLMHDTKVPRCVLDIVARRPDRKFVEYLLRHCGTPVSLRVLENIKRLKSVSWLQDSRGVLVDLSGPAQAAAVEFAIASGIDRKDVFDLLILLLEQGKGEGRRASCAGLARFHSEQADRYILTALDDPEPTVRAAAVGQLRGRGILDAMEKLVAMLDDSATLTRDAARSSLTEFNFARYETLYDSMDEPTRLSVGKLVGKVDHEAPRRLAEMLSSPSPSTKVRGLEMVLSTHLADEVSDSLLHLLDDSDLAIRADAAEALGLCTDKKAVVALEHAVRDSSRAVREAAQKSIDQITRRLEPNARRNLVSGQAR